MTGTTPGGQPGAGDGSTSQAPTPPGSASAAGPSGTTARVSITVALIAATAAIIGAVITSSCGRSEPPPVPPVTSDEIWSASPTEQDSPSPTPPDSPDAPKEDKPKQSAPAAVRWRGPVTLPFALNVASSEGMELDTKKPVLSGVDDDLRGDYQASPTVIVLSGHAAEAPGDVADLDRADCEERLPPGLSQGPAWIGVFRGNGMGGTYCFATTEGALGAFSIKSADPILPESVTLSVVLWD